MNGNCGELFWLEAVEGFAVAKLLYDPGEQDDSVLAVEVGDDEFGKVETFGEADGVCPARVVWIGHDSLDGVAVGDDPHFHVGHQLIEGGWKTHVGGAGPLHAASIAASACSSLVAKPCRRSCSRLDPVPSLQ